MSTLTSAPIGVPPLGLWQRLRDKFSKPMQATSGDLDIRVSELELEVSVLQTQVAYAQDRLNQVQQAMQAWGAPKEVLPTDVFIGGCRYSETGEAYWTTSNGPGDRWIGGARVSPEGDQIMVAP